MIKIIEFVKTVYANSSSVLEKDINKCIEETTNGYCIDIKILGETPYPSSFVAVLYFTKKVEYTDLGPG